MAEKAPENKRDLAYKLFDEGKRPGDLEVKALGLKTRSTYTYFTSWKKRNGGTTEPGGGTNKGAQSSTTGRIEVGKITIATENWALNQYGALLVLDTYARSKADIEYQGSIGDFICDVFLFYRRIQNYKEVQHGGEGSGSDGEKGAEAAPELIEQ